MYGRVVDSDAHTCRDDNSNDGSNIAELASVPAHVAIIMDGNGRWAKERGKERLEGHKAGTASVRAITESCREKGIRYLTLFSFSTENWNRSSSEVSGLMSLFQQNLNNELSTLLKNDVRLRAIGDLERLPKSVRTALNLAMKRTEKNSGLDLILAVSYGGREEIVAAARSLAERVKTGEIQPSDISSEVFSQSLWSSDIPDPDLLIRTSGEMRISNFLLWQLAYSEIVVSPVLWPDFNKEVFTSCLEEYSLRERRFGLTSEQLAPR
jgi:undecaprenyl diphosphate synthase